MTQKTKSWSLSQTVTALFCIVAGGGSILFTSAMLAKGRDKDVLQSERTERIQLATSLLGKSSGSCDESRAFPRVNAEIKAIADDSALAFATGRTYGAKLTNEALSIKEHAVIMDTLKKVETRGYQICFDQQLNIEQGNYRFAAVVYPDAKVISIAPLFNTHEAASILAKSFQYIADGKDSQTGSDISVLIAEGTGVQSKNRAYYNPLQLTYWEARNRNPFPKPPVQ